MHHILLRVTSLVGTVLGLYNDTPHGSWNLKTTLFWDFRKKNKIIVWKQHINITLMIFFTDSIGNYNFWIPKSEEPFSSTNMPGECHCHLKGPSLVGENSIYFAMTSLRAIRTNTGHCPLVSHMPGVSCWIPNEMGLSTHPFGDVLM